MTQNAGARLPSTAAPLPLVQHATLHGRGQLTLPKQVREALHIEAGDPVEFEVHGATVILRGKKMVDAEFAWFWTEEWQAAERAADEQLAAGKGQVFQSADEMLKALAKTVSPARPARRSRA